MPNCSPSSLSLAGSPGGRAGGSLSEPMRGSGPSSSPTTPCRSDRCRGSSFERSAGGVAVIPPFPTLFFLPAGAGGRVLNFDRRGRGLASSRGNVRLLATPAVRSEHAPRPGGRGGSSPPSSGIRGKKVCLRAGGLRCPRRKRCSREDPGEVAGPSRTVSGCTPLGAPAGGATRRARSTLDTPGRGLFASGSPAAPGRVTVCLPSLARSRPGRKAGISYGRGYRSAEATPQLFRTSK